jgi:formylglycine-generating enzyme required for sulfatase activity
MTSLYEVEISEDRISELVKLLAEDQKFTSVEIAETLWLASRIESRETNESEIQIEIDEKGESSDLDSAPIVEDLNSEGMDNVLPPPTPSPRANIATHLPRAGVLPTQALPVWLVDPSILKDPLEIIRALKPLLQPVEAGHGRLLDEPATVDQIARTRLWLPILAPEREPWFDIILAVDRGSSMHIWQRLVTDLVFILRRYGAFRDLQVFYFEVNREARKEDRVLLRSHPDRPGHRPSELIDQRGRRIAIVLSDCAGAYWWDGTLLPMLQDWAQVMPAVVWQMLPEWMWERTALGRGSAVALSNDRPGAANGRLIVQKLERGDGSKTPATTAHQLAMPVVTSEIRDLANWSLMLAGDRREVTPGFLLPQQGRSVPKSRTIEDMARDRVRQTSGTGSDDQDAAVVAEMEKIARSRVERFRALSSPHARRLVMLLAAAPVITLPVVRLIRDSMLYQARSPLPIAEVFLGGLLQRLPGQEEIEPDLVQYDFAPKVREVLLEILPAVETIEVINKVSEAVEKRWNKISTQSFRAFLTDPNVPAPEGLEGLRSFASVTATILEQLGREEYADFVRRLRQGAGEEPLPDRSEPDNVVFPNLEPFEFIDAQLVDEAEPNPEPAFPPPLQTEEFTVITVQLQSEPKSDQELDSFEFSVVTLQSRTTRQQGRNKSTRPAIRWVTKRRQQRAYRFFEPLPDTLSLEMVAIPHGTLLMGSPNNEPGRTSNESPQHEVTVAHFFISRYPITQAQWLTVSVMPQVERVLDPNPSYFKEDNRPVEKVSWYDAVEFCARLSAYTGREYHLPTEAEWEYACRAGTTTPFHFGDMITTQVANYSGKSSYNGGPRGESRGATTPIDQFKLANTFGLSDMHGNVFEWCQDHWHDDYTGAPTDGSAWLTNNERARHVLRGGSWFSNPGACRSAARHFDVPDSRSVTVGFRVICSAPR